MDINFTAFRIVRVARLLRMLKASQEMQMLLKTLYLALNNIANVCLLFSLIVFVFTVAGMDLFGSVSEGADGFINANANFTSFYLGMILLIRTSTGESWNGVMHDTNHIDSVLSPLFWIVYTFIGFFVYINVLIAVIFEEYGNASLQESANGELKKNLDNKDILAFLDTWAHFDPEATHWIKTYHFPDFLL
jgi:hypothetical protein